MPPVQIIPIEQINVVARQNNHSRLLDVVPRQLLHSTLKQDGLARVRELGDHFWRRHWVCFDHIVGLLFSKNYFINLMKVNLN